MNKIRIGINNNLLIKIQCEKEIILLSRERDRIRINNYFHKSKIINKEKRSNALPQKKENQELNSQSEWDEQLRLLKHVIP